MNNDNTHICWPPVFLSPTSLHHATKKQRQQAQINTAKILVVLCFSQIRERFQPKLCESNTIQYLRRSIATDMNNLRPTGKVIRQRKGHISLCCLFNACNRKFEANFGNVGLSGRAWGSWVGGGGGRSGMFQGCNEVGLRILYPLDERTVYDLFAIKRRYIMLQRQSQSLSMVNKIVYS